MLPQAAAPAQAPTPEAPFWRSALRHLGTALLAVAAIALAVGLLSMPVKAQARAERIAPLQGLPAERGEPALRRDGINAQPIARGWAAGPQGIADSLHAPVPARQPFRVGQAAAFAQD